MRAGHKAGQGAVAAGQSRVEIGGRVGGDFEAEGPGLCRHPIVGDLLALAVGRAGDANTVMGAPTDLREQAFGEGKAFGERPVEGGGEHHGSLP